MYSVTESSSAAGAALLEAVRDLRDRVADVTLPLETEDVAQARVDRAGLLAQLDDYVIPRLTDLDSPLLAVVGGSTGAGKSTLVNTICGRVVSRSGVLRPTTRACVLVHHPDDAPWFTTPRVLPHLTRISGDSGGEDPSALRLVEAGSLPAGVALIDAPDIDSVVEANRDLARQLLAAADLWVFVTTAARYADAVPWSFLRDAVERGTSVAVVLDRVPPGAEEEVGEHLAQMLVDEGLRHAPVFTLTESTIGDDGLLPHEQVSELADWLTRLGQDSRARGLLVRRTLSGALAALDRRAGDLAEASSRQVQTLEQLHAVVVSSYAESLDSVSAGVSDGTLLRGEVLARWHEYVGTGELFKQIEVGFGRLRDRFVAAVQGKPAPATELGEALQSGVAELILAHAERAELDIARRWRQTPGGRGVAPDGLELGRIRPGLRDDTERLVREWQNDILELVREEGGDRRSTARVLSMGVNAIGVVLMLVVFSHTAGALAGAELGIAGGSAVVAQRLLEAVFGDQAVRDLAAKARRRLMERTEELYAHEQARLLDLVDAVSVDPETPRALLESAARVRSVR